MWQNLFLVLNTLIIVFSLHIFLWKNCSKLSGSLLILKTYRPKPYGIGIKRDVTVKMHEVGEDNQVRVNTTWRTNTGVIDATSIVRVSSTV